jgi:hypothetical protein
MYKEIIASLVTTLMVASVLVTSGLAKPLNTYPTFMGNVGDFYVVVGQSAAASDVAGAIDVAANLAQLSYQTVDITSTSAAVTGIERKIAIPTTSTGGQIGGTTSNNLPNILKAYHYSGLKQGQIDYLGTKYNYIELVELKTGTSKTPQMTHKLGDPVNGTLKMKIDTNDIAYKYQFTSAIQFGYTSANASSYQNPLAIKVADQDFKIVAIPSSTSFTALVGTVKWLSEGESMTAGDLTIKLIGAYTGTKAKVEVTDPNGNVVWSSMATSTTTSITYGSDTYKVKVLDSAAPTVAGQAGIAQIIFGKGDVEKTFDGSDTSTLSAWGSNWRIAGQFASGTTGNVAALDNITVTYSPPSLAEADKYYLAGSVFKGPSDYFELSYIGLYPSDFAKITIAPVTGKTIYNSTASSGYASQSGLNGLEISTDVGGSIVSGANGYGKVYVLFNATPANGNFNSIGVWTGYYEPTTQRVVQLSPTAGAFGANSSAASPLFTFTLSYGGPGASSQFVLNGTFNANTIFGQVSLYGSSEEARFAFQNRTPALASSTPEIILGATVSSANSNDAMALVEGTLTDVSTQLKDLITDGGVQLYTVNSNVLSDKAMVGIAPEQVFAKVQFGKIGQTSTTGGTVKQVVPITAAVAKLDSEVTDAIKTGKNLVLVGGPCKNSLVADLKTAGKFAYGCSDWPGQNFALIQAIDDGFATGKVAVVVAGTTADDTRLASSVLQDYADKLSSITASTVNVTGTTLATAIITAQ